MEAFCHAAPSCGLSTTRNAGNGSAQLLTDDDLRTERAPVKEPAKRWFMWWLAKASGVSLTVVESSVSYELPKNEPWQAPAIYPSRDAADTEARDIIGKIRAPYPDVSERDFSELILEYLGAYPDGERPS